MNENQTIRDYNIHDYPVLIKITLENDTIIYDSHYGFYSRSDFLESWMVWKSMLKNKIPVSVNNSLPIKLEEIYGIDNIQLELSNIHE